MRKLRITKRLIVDAFFEGLFIGMFAGSLARHMGWL